MTNHNNGLYISDLMLLNRFWYAVVIDLVEMGKDNVAINLMNVLID